MSQVHNVKPKGSEPVQQQIVSNPFSTADQIASHNVSETLNAHSAAMSSLANSAEATTPPSALDADLIEKAWVNSAEKLIQRYGADPYELQQRQAAMSRDYLKKRFNLDVGQS